MRVLLIKPNNLSDHIQPSLGLGYLARQIRRDHDVDIFDWVIFQPNYGMTCDDLGAAIPEPATLSLLALGALALIRRKR